MSLEFNGTVQYVFPDNFDIDLVIGVQQISIVDTDVLMNYCMKAYDEEFVERTKPGDILVAGKNFGYGHPHYGGMAVLRKLGISSIIAESFAPGFFRSEIVTGVGYLVVPDISKKVSKGDELQVIYEEGVVVNKTTGETIQGIKPSDIVVKLVKTHSMPKFIASELAASKTAE